MKDRSEPVDQPVMGHPAPFSVNPDKLLRSIVDVICVLDAAGTVHYISPSCIHLFGFTPEEITGKSFLKFIHPADIEKTLEVMVRKIPDCRLSNFENRYFRKDGTVVPLLWSGRWDKEDQLFYCVGRDGTEKHEIEQRLLKAQKMACLANFEFDVERNDYAYVSDTLYDILGLDKKKFPAFTAELFWTLIHPDDREMVRADVQKSQGMRNSNLEFRVVRPDGVIVYISRHREVLFNAAGEPVRRIGTLQNITDRKLSELALRQSEERFRFLVQNGTDIIGIIDSSGNYTFVSTNVEQHLGYKVADLVGNNALAFIHPEDYPGVVVSLQEAVTKDTLTIGPFRFRNSKGEWRWMETTVTNHLAHPAIGGLVVNSRDVTEKKLKEDALLISEQRFKALVQNGSDLIGVIDENANFYYFSDNLPAILGYTPDEMIGRNAFDFIHRDDKEKVANEIGLVLDQSEIAKGVQHRFLHKNGSWVWLESKGTNHKNTAAIGGILVNSRNINDRVKLQRRLNRELISKQREITAAVIKAQETERSQLGLELHDNVNQILTTVKLYNEMYLTGYVQDKELLVKSTQYTQDCINEIRSISKRLSAPTLGKISLRDSVRELVDSINLTRRLEIIYVPKNINSYAFSEDLHLAVYRIVQEGLNNIIKYSQATIACIELDVVDGQLLLKVSDNGKGFDTTAKRAGIGITNMKTRAENMNGTFQLESSPGKGCEVKISFPLAYEPQQPSWVSATSVGGDA